MTAEEIITELELVCDELQEVDDRQAKLRERRDDLVAKAREIDVPYAAITGATGMSNSWINSSLVRSGGPRPRAGRPRRREE